MWLVILLSASVVATAVYFSKRESSKYLVLILWAATVMVFIDWLLSYVEEGEFIPSEVFEDPVGSSLLGFAMVLTGVVLWAILALASRLIKGRANE